MAGGAKEGSTLLALGSTDKGSTVVPRSGDLLRI